MARARWAVGVLGLLALLPALAADTTVKQLVTLVQTAVRKQESDEKLAGRLRKITLAERLDDRTVEELESLGAGPKAVAELLDLRDGSVHLPPPSELPLFLSPAVPKPAEWNEALQQAARHAIQYTHSLPDFICTQTVRRYEHLRNAAQWRLKDILTVKLTYFDYHEKYQLVAVDDHPTTLTYRTAGGAISEGEFGSCLLSVFDPESKARFLWDHWTTLRGHQAQVLSYRIDAAHSTYRLSLLVGARSMETTPGAHGFVYVDRETGETLRLIRIADIDPAFPVKSAVLSLDYDFTDVAGGRYLVPWKSDMRMATNFVDTRNEVIFHDYRKFTGDSSIRFDAPEEKHPF